MTLLFKYIFKPLYDLAVNIVKGIAMWFLRQMVSFIRFSWPHLLKLVLQSLWYAIQMVGAAIMSLFKGMAVVDVMASHWQAEALAIGFPTIWERELLFVMRVLAVFTIVSGWAIIFFTGYVTTDIAFNLLFPSP